MRYAATIEQYPHAQALMLCEGKASHVRALVVHTVPGQTLQTREPFYRRGMR